MDDLNIDSRFIDYEGNVNKYHAEEVIKRSKVIIRNLENTHRRVLNSSVYIQKYIPSDEN